MGPETSFQSTEVRWLETRGDPCRPLSSVNIAASRSCFVCSQYAPVDNGRVGGTGYCHARDRTLNQPIHTPFTLITDAGSTAPTLTFNCDCASIALRAQASHHPDCGGHRWNSVSGMHAANQGVWRGAERSEKHRGRAASALWLLHRRRGVDRNFNLNLLSIPFPHVCRACLLAHRFTVALGQDGKLLPVGTMALLNKVEWSQLTPEEGGKRADRCDLS